MDATDLDYAVDLDDELKPKRLGGYFAVGDGSAHKVNVTATQGGASASLTGCTVQGVVVLPNGSTVTATGSVSGSVASVTLPAAAFVLPGRITVSVKLTSGSIEKTILVLVGEVLQTSTTSTVTVDDVSELEDAKADIKEAIEGAGVTVPSGTTIGGYAELIAQIASGCKTGTFTGTGGATTIAHGLGSTPTVIAVVGLAVGQGVTMANYSSASGVTLGTAMVYTGTGLSAAVASVITSIGSTSFTVGISGYYPASGITYRWFAC